MNLDRIVFFFKLSHFGQLFTLDGIVCVINLSHSIQWIVFKPCIPFADIMKMCIWSFD